MPFLKYGRPVSLGWLTPWTPYFSYTLDKTILNHFACAHPRPPPSVVAQFKIYHRAENNKKDTPLSVLFVILGAEAGFEPRDLRVMSPTSYQAALLRDI